MHTGRPKAGHCLLALAGVVTLVMTGAHTAHATPEPRACTIAPFEYTDVVMWDINNDGTFDGFKGSGQSTIDCGDGYQLDRAAITIGQVAQLDLARYCSSDGWTGVAHSERTVTGRTVVGLTLDDETHRLTGTIRGRIVADGADVIPMLVQAHGSGAAKLEMHQEHRGWCALDGSLAISTVDAAMFWCQDTCGHGSH